MPTRTHDQNQLLLGSKNALCMDCGFKFKSIDLRIRPRDKLIVCKDCWEPRHPAEYYNYKAFNEGGGGGSLSNPEPEDSGGTDVSGETFPPALVVDSKTFEDHENGTLFEYQFTAQGAAPNNITWTLSSGTLPTGTALSPDGVVSGTVTATGDSTFTLLATSDDGRTDTEAFTVTTVDSWDDFILASGPAFWYKFGKGSDFTNYATTATDVTDATLEPTPPVEGTAQTDTFITATSGPGNNFPDAGDFNGATSFLYQPRYTAIADLPGTPAAGGHLMIEAVVWLDQLGTGKNYTLAAFGPYLHGNGSNRGWRIWVNGTTGRLQYQILGSQQADHWACTLDFVFPTAQWVHVMFNMAVRPNDNPGENFIYVDGVSRTLEKLGGNDYATAYGDGPTELRIGAEREYTGTYTDGEPFWYWDGKIAEIIGWQSDDNTDGFSAADIELHYATTGLGS